MPDLWMVNVTVSALVAVLLWQYTRADDEARALQADSYAHLFRQM